MGPGGLQLIKELVQVGTGNFTVELSLPPHLRTSQHPSTPTLRPNCITTRIPDPLTNPPSDPHPNPNRPHQVESLAQLGVQLLLFSLGRELSLSKLRPVLRVALLGGCLQILALTAIGGAVGGVIGGSIQQGLFVGALLSMSSTSVVIKCLETTRSTATAYGQLTIGTLILQDCSVGLMFALMPAFAHKSGARAGDAAAAAVTAAAAEVAASGGGGGRGGSGGTGGGSGAVATGGAAIAAALAAAEANDDLFARMAVVMLVLRVLVKLAMVVVAAYAIARTVLPPLLKVMAR